MQPGDCIILDFGCLWEGLHSDMTRTIFLESVPAEFKRLYWLLYRAQTAKEPRLIIDRGSLQFHTLSHDPLI